MGLCESVESHFNTKSCICPTVYDRLKKRSWKQTPCCEVISPTIVPHVNHISSSSLSSNGTLSSTLRGSATANQSSIVFDDALSLRLTLTDSQKRCMQRFWRETINVSARDIFHRTMLFCIEASPKLNEIIACGHYCFRDLTKWPKLNRICQAQFHFFERIILDWACDEQRVRNASVQLGITHARYATYGLKPHFLDIFQQQFIGLLQKSARDSEMPQLERDAMLTGFMALTGFIIDAMNVGQNSRGKSNVHR